MTRQHSEIYLVGLLIWESVSQFRPLDPLLFFVGRVTITQSASLNLFSSKEQEIELRAQLLKRLTFTVFCSDLDQYQRSMPEIQERLSDSLRLPSVPSVQAQVFLCFRVLIMRVSPQHLTSMWPTIITELVSCRLPESHQLWFLFVSFFNRFKFCCKLSKSCVQIWKTRGKKWKKYNQELYIYYFIFIVYIKFLCFL